MFYLPLFCGAHTLLSVLHFYGRPDLLVELFKVQSSQFVGVCNSVDLPSALRTEANDDQQRKRCLKLRQLNHPI